MGEIFQQFSYKCASNLNGEIALKNVILQERKMDISLIRDQTQVIIEAHLTLRLPAT